MSPAFVQKHFLELLADWLEESINGEVRTCVDCGRATTRVRCVGCDQALYRAQKNERRRVRPLEAVA